MSREFLRVFREINSLSNGRVGYAAVEVRDGAIWADACTRAMALGEALRAELVELVDSATPLGRLSAAALLARFDREAGTAAFERLRHEDGAVHHASGCMVTSEAVADVARSVLGSGVLRGEVVVPSQAPVVLGDVAAAAIRDLVVRPADTAPLEPWPGLPKPGGSARRESSSFALWLGVSLAMFAALAGLYWLSR